MCYRKLYDKVWRTKRYLLSKSSGVNRCRSDRQVLHHHVHQVHHGHHGYHGHHQMVGQPLVW